MGKGKGKAKKGKKSRRYGRKAKHVVNAARAKTFRILKGAALEAPLILYVVEGLNMTKGQGLATRLGDVASRLGLGTTGIHYTIGSGKVEFLPQYLLLGWGGPLAYKGVQFAMNAIPGKKDSPFAELAALTG